MISDNVNTMKPRILLVIAALVAFGGSLGSGFHFDDYSIFDERTWHYGEQPKNVKDLQTPLGDVRDSGHSGDRRINDLSVTPKGSTTPHDYAIFNDISLARVLTL